MSATVSNKFTIWAANKKGKLIFEQFQPDYVEVSVYSRETLDLDVWVLDGSLHVSLRDLSNVTYALGTSSDVMEGR